MSTTPEAARTWFRGSGVSGLLGCWVIAEQLSNQATNLRRDPATSLHRDGARLLVFCDEAADASNPLEALQSGLTAPGGIDVLIGPEGGFAEEERVILLRQPKTLRLSLGPRILRADTAAVAALALAQAALGDWTATGLRG